MNAGDAGTAEVADADSVTLGLLVAPGLPEELGRELADELAPLLAERVTDAVDWSVPVLADPVAGDPHGGATAMVDAARRRMLAEGWDLAVVLTDLPLRSGPRPVVADASATHGVALLSLPALGAVGLRRRSIDALLRLVDGLAGESLDLRSASGAAGAAARAARRDRIDRRLKELAAPVRPERADDDDLDVRYVAAVVRGNLRLLTGMVRANRPWRLIARLSRALTAAIATAVFAVVTSDIWRLADTLGWVRLSLLSVLSISGIVVFLIVAHGLWERPQRRGLREQAILFNVATTSTLALGVVTLHVALLLLTIAGAALLVDPDAMTQQLGHDVGLAGYVRLAWLAGSLATIAGALGAGLESDAAVREAAYGYRSTCSSLSS
ncbi:hypothetical protein VSS74_02210 [Conexibacter stalactiti]|uniref:Uncharacterized protein n=1 Tax=Conexibacter stalactiti TaxID=1940611 RepID=A0ABU4HIK3_9ACTN|nr:hypothetical protein [Conexibacter stalactiti]MDW5593133.1 hypothetical protein [Conexibacter stalactiti]MEC5033774.1 hypothetical protein [Conexibacter stalactiti]